MAKDDHDHDHDHERGEWSYFRNRMWCEISLASLSVSRSFGWACVDFSCLRLCRSIHVCDGCWCWNGGINVRWVEGGRFPKKCKSLSTRITSIAWSKLVECGKDVMSKGFREDFGPGEDSYLWVPIWWIFWTARWWSSSPLKYVQSAQVQCVFWSLVDNEMLFLSLRFEIWDWRLEIGDWRGVEDIENSNV